MGQRLPTAVLEMRNSFKANPDLKRHNEPIPETVFPKHPPKHLTKEERATWREIKRLTPPGVLTGSDVIQVELCARLLAEYRSKASPPGWMISTLSRETGKLGLNPAARSGLSVDPTKKNKYAD